MRFRSFSTLVDDMNATNRRTDKIVALLLEKVRLERSHRRLVYFVFGILWLSGALWLVGESLKESEFGPARSPLQTMSMKIHGAAMLVYLVTLGTLWTHVRRGFALRTNRSSGSLVITVNAVLILSGWILYYVTEDVLRERSSLIHWAVGLAVLPLLLAHIWLGRAQSAKLRGQELADTERGSPRQQKSSPGQQRRCG